MRLVTLIGCGMMLILNSSCLDDKKETEPEVKTVETTAQKSVNEASEIEATFSEDVVQQIFKEYIDLKTALVNTDASTAQAAASRLMTSFANKGVDEVTMKAAQDIVETEDVETQRKQFVVVTQTVEKLLEGAIQEGTIYKQFCPMAFGNTGAYWLSESKEIRNPYFGDKMLKCGRIDAEIN